MKSKIQNETSHKCYIIICGFFDVVAGGPIYYNNKIRYMEERGWQVVVIPTNGGDNVLIHGMERFIGRYVPFILDNPNEYDKSQREKLVDYLESFVPKERGETIVETGTDYTNFWGEALAERIHAKHVVIFLDEHNERIDEQVIDFYKFKYFRGELACITKPAMMNLLGNYMELSLDRCVNLMCSCYNSVEDYEHPLITKIVRGDYNLGYIGRLEKEFVSVVLDGFIEFANKVDNKSVTVVLFGGAFEYKTIEQIKARLSPIKNITLFITGYIFPLPLEALKKMDVFVSGAGSAIAAVKAGCLSVRLDMYSYRPLGIMNDSSLVNYAKCPSGESIYDYLRWILIDREAPLPPAPTYQNDWTEIRKDFDKHLSFIDSSSPTPEYYDLNALGISKLRKRKKIARAILGVQCYNALHESKLYLWIWHVLQKIKGA